METEHWGYKKVGYKYKTGSRFVTPTELDLFCDITGMRDNVFLSDEVGRAYGAKRRVVPGAFLLAISIGLLRETGLITAPRTFYLGTDNFKVNTPVYLYETLRLEGELLHRRVTSEGDRVVVRYSFLMKNQDDVVVAQGENICIFPNPEFKSSEKT